MREPEFIGGEVDLRINIYRGQFGANNAIGTKNGVNNMRNGTNKIEAVQKKKQMQVEKLMQLVEKYPSATQAYYAEGIVQIRKEKFGEL